MRKMSIAAAGTGDIGKTRGSAWPAIHARILCVTSHPFRPRNCRLAMALTMLALFAQFWMAQMGTAHLGQMLSKQALMRDVCSAMVAHNSGQAPDAPPAHAADSGLNCLICGAAVASFTSTSVPIAVAASAEEAFYRIRAASGHVTEPRYANLRPPAQAPPAAA